MEAMETAPALGLEPPGGLGTAAGRGGRLPGWHSHARPQPTSAGAHIPRAWGWQRAVGSPGLLLLLLPCPSSLRWGSEATGSVAQPGRAAAGRAMALGTKSVLYRGLMISGARAPMNFHPENKDLYPAEIGLIKNKLS